MNKKNYDDLIYPIGSLLYTLSNLLESKYFERIKNDMTCDFERFLNHHYEDFNSEDFRTAIYTRAGLYTEKTKQKNQFCKCGKKGLYTGLDTMQEVFCYRSWEKGSWEKGCVKKIYWKEGYWKGGFWVEERNLGNKIVCRECRIVHPERMFKKKELDEWEDSVF